jgi:hypothetical protein
MMYDIHKKSVSAEAYRIEIPFYTSAKTMRAMLGPATARLDGETLNEFYFVSPPGPPNRSIGETA